MCLDRVSVRLHARSYAFFQLVFIQLVLRASLSRGCWRDCDGPSGGLQINHRSSNLDYSDYQFPGTIFSP